MPTRSALTTTNLVAFRLDSIYYAIEITPIRQIIEMVTITPVLKASAWMEGMINYHGVSVPVINLRRHFGVTVTPYRWHTPIILVNIAGHAVGMIVDDVLDVLAITPDKIIAPQTIFPVGIPAVPLLKGIIQSDEYVTFLLDLEHLFDRDQVETLSLATRTLKQTAPQPEASVRAAKKKKGGALPVEGATQGGAA